MLMATQENGEVNMGSNILIPMLFMDSSENNQNLLFYMMMMDSAKTCRKEIKIETEDYDYYENDYDTNNNFSKEKNKIDSSKSEESKSTSLPAKPSFDLAKNGEVQISLDNIDLKPETGNPEIAAVKDVIKKLNILRKDLDGEMRSIRKKKISVERALGKFILEDLREIHFDLRYYDDDIKVWFPNFHLF